MSAKPTIILVAPQMGENIGAAARAMANFGLQDLRIVAPRDGWPNPKADEMAAHGVEIVKKAQVFESLEAAVADLQHVMAATARHRDMQKPHLAAREWAEGTYPGKIGILFGRESSGLNNDEISLADAIVSIPVDEKHPSLNIAQAVGILCYEWRMGQVSGVGCQVSGEEKAKKQEVTELFAHLEGELDARQFFRVKEKRPRMVRNIRNIFTKAQLTQQEASTLRGVIRSLATEKKHKM